MLPAVVDYFYEVEAALSSDSNTASFGFEGDQVSVDEIMVRMIRLTAFRNICALLRSHMTRTRYSMRFAPF